MDLAEWVAARRYSGLLELIDQLPSASRYSEAVVNHPEYAKQLAEAPEPSEAWTPRQAEFGLTEHLLTNISDQLQVLTVVTLKAAGGKPGDPKPMPRPKSAIEEAKKQAEMEWAKEFIQQFGFSPDDI